MMVFNFNTAESNFKTLRQNKIGVRKGETEIALKKKNNLPCTMGGGADSEILKMPLRDTTIQFCGCGLNCFSPL